VRADSQRLTQAIMQLAENACQHTDSTGAVRIGSAVVRGVLRLWVRDDGPGVAPGDSERIFERFVKASDRRAGSGLGLSIVAAIAEAHGGRARVVPHIGRGALFEITAPVVPVDEQVAAPAEKTAVDEAASLG
jgi:signal transduction histidine kinase